ncbi:MAG: HAD family hydrolase [Candidatus Edwardsbacteria bacterium]|nr:HAD family hydrolase [Candidatus Edwardsbacteria bacterium]
MPRIKAITFDLWETLIADSTVQNDLRTEYRVAKTVQLLLSIGVAVDISDLYAAHEEVWRRCEEMWDRAVDLPFPDQIRLFLDLARPGLAASLPRAAVDQIGQVYADAVLHYPPGLIPETADALRALRKKRYRLGLICNTGRSPGFILREMLEKFGILKRFNLALFSDETIVRKPDPAIFRLALKELKAEPSEAIHVGDSPENDVRGAIAAGLQAVWIRKPGAPEPECLASVDSVAELPAVLEALEN